MSKSYIFKIDKCVNCKKDNKKNIVYRLSEMASVRYMTNTNMNKKLLVPYSGVKQFHSFIFD